MTYTPDDITAFIAQRVAAVGEDKGVRIIKQQAVEIERLREALDSVVEYTDAGIQDWPKVAIAQQVCRQISRAALSTREKAYD